jgi:phospholipase/carboxylesterase
VAGGEAAPGVRPLGSGRGRDGLVYVPPGHRADRPAPLLLMLHGAGGEARQAMAMAIPAAEAGGVLLAAPDSRGRTWDVILGGYGPDVLLIDRVLADLFAGHAVDPDRVAIGGFSDGASYALSLGLANGDLFARVLAFSPGFVAPAPPRGAPRIFVSHGTRDDVLPIGRTSRRLVPALRRAGREVDYREFDGGHVVPPEIAAEAIGRFAAGDDGSRTRGDVGGS